MWRQLLWWPEIISRSWNKRRYRSRGKATRYIPTLPVSSEGSPFIELVEEEVVVQSVAHLAHSRSTLAPLLFAASLIPSPLRRGRELNPLHRYP